MSKYIVETFYTCTFKIVHKLDELNEKKLSDLENRKDGKFEVIDIVLNNRKTKTNTDTKVEIDSQKNQKEISSGISNIVNEKISNIDKQNILNENSKTNISTKNLV